ncbi:hypothetical protein PN466_14350 [Roseofilum reptotaenium CS-1145]|uniref:Outer membrane lipoprotein BamD-like domain-containing protein n=1 Tax=Roseofilum reptotaenium AO1-A TaxID=1925591 RepID=A0A1L9QVY5_9CYAN|nr:hypothetical protein [Roseofilum reptotaenium]MDB9518129.1 hypothetical protein [Roseofilum reptotaenium CS-1145]OJJ26799.1 hypothetical protein BI308_03635 [Roseofilum reptotaenium AO1-A]
MEVLERGKQAFERGDYREAIADLEAAKGQVSGSSALGGEVQIWLVTAYEAAGKRDEALSLCETLDNHPDWHTRKQARRLLEILKAPQLNRRSEWNTTIPDLSAMEESDRLYRQGTGTTQVKPPKSKEELEPVDLSSVETEDNRFLWVALVAIALIIGGWIGFG